MTGWCKHCGLRIVQTGGPSDGKVWVHVRTRDMHCPSASVAEPKDEAA